MSYCDTVGRPSEPSPSSFVSTSRFCDSSGSRAMLPSNDDRPSSNTHLPPPPVMAKLNWKLQLFLLYAACIDGMIGALASPLKVLVVLPKFLAP